MRCGLGLTRGMTGRAGRLGALLVVALMAGPAHAALRLGVNTHFDQGWPRAALAKVAQAGASSIRDTVTWGKVEQAPGRYSFTERNSGYVDQACRQGNEVLLVVLPRNRIYDGGRAVFSANGQRALGRYVGALVDRFACVVGVEVGNEINTASANWPSKDARPAMYVAMLKAVRAELSRRARRVALVGGSSIGVSVEFHARLFAAGELPLIDAVAVHPYVDAPERLIAQFDNLRRAMALHGAIKPIWATEFGNYYKTPDAAPPHALKVMTIMSAAGVDRAYWYALLDEPWFPNMGLYGAKGAKPALQTFQLAVRRLLAAGDARRSPSRPDAFVYRFGTGPYVMWGRGALSFGAGARALDARGRPIAVPQTLSDEPVVVTSPGGVVID